VIGVTITQQLLAFLTWRFLQTQWDVGARIQGLELAQRWLTYKGGGFFVKGNSLYKNHIPYSLNFLKGFTFFRYIGCWTLAALSLISFVSPIIMVILPQLDVMGLRENQKKCEVRIVEQTKFDPLNPKSI